MLVLTSPLQNGFSRWPEPSALLRGATSGAGGFRGTRVTVGLSHALGAVDCDAAQSGSAQSVLLPGYAAPLARAGRWRSLPSVGLRMVRSVWVTRWARCKACRPGGHSARASLVATFWRAPTVPSGFRPGVQETASARVGLVFGDSAEGEAGMVNTGKRKVTGSTPWSGSLLYF